MTQHFLQNIVFDPELPFIHVLWRALPPAGHLQPQSHLIWRWPPDLTQCPTNCFLYSEKSPKIAIFLVPYINVNSDGVKLWFGGTQKGLNPIWGYASIKRLRTPDVNSDDGGIYFRTTKDRKTLDKANQRESFIWLHSRSHLMWSFCNRINLITLTKG